MWWVLSFYLKLECCPQHQRFWHSCSSCQTAGLLAMTERGNVKTLQVFNAQILWYWCFFLALPFQDTLFHPKYTGEELTCTVKNLKRSTQYKFRVSQSFWYLNCLKKKLFYVSPTYYFKLMLQVKIFLKFTAFTFLKKHYKMHTKL